MENGKKIQSRAPRTEKDNTFIRDTSHARNRQQKTEEDRVEGLRSKLQFRPSVACCVNFGHILRFFGLGRLDGITL